MVAGSPGSFSGLLDATTKIAFRAVQVRTHLGWKIAKPCPAAQIERDEAVRGD